LRSPALRCARAAPSEHAECCSRDAQRHRQIGVDDAADLLVGRAARILAPQHGARGVHDAVEPAQPLAALGHARLGRARLEQVAGEGLHALELLQGVGAPARGEHAGTLRRADLRDRAADARRGSRDEDAASLEHG
jgi:hypothetical protein